MNNQDLEELKDPNIEVYATFGGSLIVSLIDEDAPLVTLSPNDKRYARAIAVALLTSPLTPGGSNAK